MKNLFLLPTILLFSLSIFAADIYWIGNSGPWNNATRWSYDNATPCFCTPSNTDVVLINAGQNLIVPSGYTAMAKRIVINSLDTLRIETNASLNIKFSDGIGIRLYNAVIENYGTIDIDSANTTGIQMQSDLSIFHNYGFLSINKFNATSAFSGGIQAFAGHFINEATGIIYISNLNNNTVRSGIRIDQNNNDTTLIENRGLITVQGNFLYGIYIDEQGTFRNADSLNIDGCTLGVYMLINSSSPQASYPIFFNDINAQLNITDTANGGKFTAISIISSKQFSPVLTNDGGVKISNNYDVGIRIRGGIFNNNSEITLDGPKYGISILTASNSTLPSKFNNTSGAKCEIFNTTSLGLFVEDQTILDVLPNSHFSINTAGGDVAEINSDATIDFDFDIRP